MILQDKPTTLSLLGNIKPFVLTSTTSVTFLLKKGDTVVVEQTYDPSSSGVITIDLKDVLAGYFEYKISDQTMPYLQPNIVGEFSAIFDSDVHYNFIVVRAGVDMLADTANNFFTANWLTWQPQIKAVTYSSPEYLTYYAIVDCKAVLKATMQDDTVRSLDLVSMLAGTAYTIPCQYATISTQLGGALPKYYDIYTQDGAGNRLSYIQRYYPSSFLSEQEQWILFENSLGGLDTFRAYGQMDFEGSHTHNIAEIDEIATEYRIDTDRKFKKNTGHIDEYDRRWLLDFFPSRGKYIYIGSSLRRIVVTESNVTYVDKELPSSFEFTYKYADSTPFLNLQRTDSLPADITISIPEAGSFTVPPRLIDFPRLPITEGALLPMQSPYDEKWCTMTIGSLTNYLKEHIGSNATPCHEFILSPKTDADGIIIESPESWLRRIPLSLRRVGMEVVLRTSLYDDTYTRYAFTTGIQDKDFIPINYFVGIAEYIIDSLDSDATDKALSAHQGKVLKEMIKNKKLNCGTYG